MPSVGAAVGQTQCVGTAAMVQWVKREHSKGVIDKEGLLLVPWWQSHKVGPDELGALSAAILVVDNWRSSHAFPLNTFQVNLRKRARRIDPNTIIAQRQKRLKSVLNKLARESHMKLSQMHDLGGCRAIVSDVDAVDRLFAMYRGDGATLFEEEASLKCYDYIRRPKSDGYRGIHVVGRYEATWEDQAAWNGQRIEIRLRTRLQHAFATAVETVATFTRTPLKFGGGTSDWKRFFSLMGASLAIREKTTRVPGVPSREAELIAELRALTKHLSVRRLLRGWANALRELPQQNMSRAKWFLLAQDAAAKTIRVTGFKDRQKGTAAAAKIEQGRSDVDVVLVSVQSIKELRTAYPNYYSDTTEFLDALDASLGKRPAK